MALKQFSGCLEFVKDPSEDFDCPVCFQIMQDPFLTACCGNHFCKVCMESTKEKNNRCPFCKEKRIAGIVDKKLQRQMNELQVHCVKRQNGCRWSGDLGKLSGHLNMDEEDGQCKYVLLSCPLTCGKKLFRYELRKHTSKECQFRTCTCKFCGYSSTYEEVTTEHYSECENYPIVCPNACTKRKLKRGNLNEHLLTCPDEVVPCSFSEMGCNEKIKRQCLQEHIEANMTQHQLMMCSSFKQMKKENSLLKEALRNAQQRANHHINGHALEFKGIRSIKWEDYLQSLPVLSDDASDPVSPVVFKWPDYSEIKRIAIEKATGFSYSDVFYYTRPFYTHSGGYKMQVTVYPYGNSSGKGTHMSVFFSLVKGENDDHLKWPFEGTILFKLLNQCEDNGHEAVMLTLSGSRILPSVVKRPDSYRNKSRGYPEFIHLSSIENPTPTCQYLMNNTLYFSIAVRI